MNSSIHGRAEGLLGKENGEAEGKIFMFPLVGGQCHYDSLAPLEIFGILSVNLYIIPIYHGCTISSIHVLLMINEYIINNE